MFDAFLEMLVLTLVPWIELRGGIPFGIISGLDPLVVFASCVIANILILFPIFFFLDYFFPFIRHWKIVDRLVQRTQKKAEPYISRWGFAGLAIMVAIPLPFTGAYSGALAAYLFGVPRVKAFQAISLGVFAAGVIVTLVFMAFEQTLLELFKLILL